MPGMSTGRNDEEPIYVISVAAQLAGMHPQTLRQYDRLGLVQPRRTSGRGRRYSRTDVAALRRIQQLSQDDGMNLAGIKRVLDLEREVAHLRTEIDRLTALVGQAGRIFAATPQGEAIPMRRGQRRPRAATAGQLTVRQGPGTQMATTSMATHSRTAALVLWEP